ncbi:hypothetical protein R1flu_024570 [Riccia fluitans]|uniref:Uncharacterized protein n=1 Tax=Riccia fluitans TaxID=41844 RepID=A0ABD1XV90_9MARC
MATTLCAFSRESTPPYLPSYLLSNQIVIHVEREGEKVTGGTGGAVSSPPPASSTLRRRTSTKPAAAVHKMEIVESKAKDQTRTWNAPSLQILPYTHHLVTEKVVSRLLYAVQLLSAMMSIGLAVWRLMDQHFSYNPHDRENSDQDNHDQTSPDQDNHCPLNSKPSNITVSMNVFYILSVAEAGMFLAERTYWEYKIRVKELLQTVNKKADLGRIWWRVSISKPGDIVSKPRGGKFAADCLRRLGKTPGIIERLVEMLSWNSKQEQALLSEVVAIICRLVVYNRNSSRIVAIPGSIEGITNLLLQQEWPNPKDKNYSRQLRPYLELRVNGLRILKSLCKDHKNSLRISDAKGLLFILIFFIEVRNHTAFQEFSNDKKDPDHEKEFFQYRIKKQKKSLQIIQLLAAAPNTSGGILRSRIAAVVLGLKNLRDVIEFGDSQPELQRLSVEILFQLAMDPDVRKTIGATGGIIRNLYDLLASYDEAPSSKTSSRPSNASQVPNLSEKSLKELQLASEMAGKTLSRIVLQNEKNCLKLVYMKSEQGEPFLKFMIKFIAEPLQKAEDAFNEEISSCRAEILRSVMNDVDEKMKMQVAEDSARVVLQLI